jgi:hypothetical protein
MGRVPRLAAKCRYLFIRASDRQSKMGVAGSEWSCQWLTICEKGELSAVSSHDAELAFEFPAFGCNSGSQILNLPVSSPGQCPSGRIHIIMHGF